MRPFAHARTTASSGSLLARASALALTVSALSACGSGEGAVTTGGAMGGRASGTTASGGTNVVSPVYARHLMLQIAKGEKTPESLTIEERRAVAAVMAAQKGR